MRRQWHPASWDSWDLNISRQYHDFQEHFQSDLENALEAEASFTYLFILNCFPFFISWELLSAELEEICMVVGKRGAACLGIIAFPEIMGLQKIINSFRHTVSPHWYLLPKLGDSLLP